jgi:hypothetical protein
LRSADAGGIAHAMPMIDPIIDPCLPGRIIAAWIVVAGSSHSTPRVSLSPNIKRHTPSRREARKP